MAEPYTGPVLPLGGGNTPTATKQPYTGEVVPLPGQPDQYGVQDVGQTVTSDRPAAAPREDAPSIASMDTTKAQGFSQGTPLEALGDLIRGKRWDEVAKIFPAAFKAVAPLSTADPRQRQLIIAKQIPGAKAVDDKYGNPMIELDGKRYHTSGGDVDVARAGLQTAGGMAIGAAIPTMPLWGTALAGGATMAGQSAAEDVVARAAGGTNRPWVDPVKAGIAGVTGAVAPYAVAKTVMPIAGDISATLRSGTTLSDEAISALGLDPAKLTPELRQSISNVARRTFGDPTAVQAAYRQGVARDFGVGLTKGEISGDPGQIAREQTLASPGAVPGSGYPRQTILDNRNVQNQQLTTAQEALRGGGQPPLDQQQAGTVLKQGAASAEAQGAAKVDQLYQTAKDPTAVVSAGGAPNAPASHVQNLGAVVRADLATTGPGRAVLEDPSLTPNAAKALAKIDELGRSTTPPQPTMSGLLGPDGRPLATVTPPAAPSPLSWEAIDNQRKMLLQYRDAAFGPNGTKTDQAAITQIIRNFDDHFGQLNPLLRDARAAHAEQMSTFRPGGSEAQDRATQTVLEQLQGPEGGTKVMNTILGGGLKKGEAEQMMDHLVTKVLPAQPEALQALKDQALRRLVVDGKGNALSPQKAATALGNALDGEAEKGVYAKLFSSDELARLRRFQDLQETIAKSRTPINPPGSGTIILDYLKHAVGGGIGGAIGYKLGSLVGMPEAGMYAGAAAGTVARTVGQRIQAMRAVNPPAVYMPSGPNTSAVPGLLGNTATPATTDQTVGPANRLMQNLTGGLLGP